MKEEEEEEEDGEWKAGEGQIEDAMGSNPTDELTTERERERDGMGWDGGIFSGNFTRDKD